MQEQMNELMMKIRGVWERFTITQRMVIGSLAIAAIGSFFMFFYWINIPDYKILYANLSVEDANRAVKMLEADKVPYKLAEDGTTILVADNQVYTMRIKIAGEGGLVGSGIGFEIFDEIKVGQTDFVQKINYQRAMQGELSRTISEFPNVESARVHLVIPQRSLFIEEQQQPSASVLLRLHDKGRKMQPKEVEGIVNMLTMAMEGLDRSRISITDNLGKPLFFPDEDGITALTATQREHKIRVEQGLEQRISELLFPVLGHGKAIAKINANLDFSQRTIRREVYDGENPVVRSQQRSEESNTGRANLDSGSTDVNFRGDGLTGSVSTQEGTRETTTTNYEINKEEHNIVSQIGEISRLTIAVVVDGLYEINAAGESVYIAREAKEIESIKALVSHAVGFDASRGDSIEVSSVPFDTNEVFFEVTGTEIMTQYLEKFGRPFLTAILGLLFLLLVVRPIVLAWVRPKVEAGEVLEELEGLPSAEEQLALYEAQEEAAQDAEAQRIESLMTDDDYFNDDSRINTLKFLEDIKVHTLQLAENNMEQSLFILRGWMRDEAQAASKA